MSNKLTEILGPDGEKIYIQYDEIELIFIPHMTSQRDRIPTRDKTKDLGEAIAMEV